MIIGRDGMPDDSEQKQGWKKMNCFFEFDKCVQWMTCNFFTYFFFVCTSLGGTEQAAKKIH